MTLFAKFPDFSFFSFFQKSQILKNVHIKMTSTLHRCTKNDTQYSPHLIQGGPVQGLRIERWLFKGGLSRGLRIERWLFKGGGLSGGLKVAVQGPVQGLRMKGGQACQGAKN